MTAEPEIIDNPSKSRFETTIEGHTARVEYKIDGNTITFEHTVLPEELRGRGLAGKLAAASLASARERKLQVTPVCEVFVNYMKKRPETHDLLSPEGKKAIA